MEPVTHFLTGACIGRAGLNRKTAYATLAAVLAAEAADLDVIWGLRGPVEELKHHRGITHTFLAVPVVAAAAVGAVWLLDRWLRAWRSRSIHAVNHNAKAPPLLWGWLYLAALLSALSHLLLDWTNNYGLRPFFPFNPHWYAGSIVFIAEPAEWALLFGALIVPWLLGLVSGEIGARRQPFRGRSWAIFTLAGMLLLGCWRWAEQGRARMLLDNTQVATAPVKRMTLEPYPINPFRWHAILETADYYQTAEIDTRTGEIVSDPHRDVIFKPPATAATEAAKRTLLGQVYLDWGTWAVVRDVGQVTAPGLAPPQLPPNRQWTTVEFTDLRFAYPFLGPGMSAPKTPNRLPLSGWVYIVDGRDDAGEAMNGREQR
ncbi:MAG: metal-dependent hydrolase [Terracidiphilus sp.]|jgi:inner membrane protein